MSLSSPTDPNVAIPLSAAVTRGWTCPFCPLLCDDIDAAQHADHTLAAPATDCSRLTGALARYGAQDGRCSASVDDDDVAPDAAIARAAELLAASHRPLFGGCATDVEGARALYTLAAHCGATLDHLDGDALAVSTLALQDRGAMFATLSEVRSRADLLVVIGCQPSLRYPRFYERVFGGTDTPREWCFVGCEADPNAHQPGAAVVAPGVDLHDLLALLAALAEGRRAESLDDGSGLAQTLATLVTRVASARYTVFVYEPATLPGAHAALLIEALQRIVKAVNRTTRAGALALGGAEGGISVNQAVTWLSGFPLRTRVAKPGRAAGLAPLDYDPHRYATARLIGEKQIDALLWIASFEPHPLPDALDPHVPAIVLGHPALWHRLGTRAAPTVFIPVATPGIDAGGHLFRLDGSVVAPLTAARGLGLPTVAQVLTQIAARLDAGSTP